MYKRLAGKLRKERKYEQRRSEKGKEDNRRRKEEWKKVKEESENKIKM